MFEWRVHGAARNWPIGHCRQRAVSVNTVAVNVSSTPNDPTSKLAFALPSAMRSNSVSNCRSPTPKAYLFVDKT